MTDKEFYQMVFLAMIEAGYSDGMADMAATMAVERSRIVSGRGIS